MEQKHGHIRNPLTVIGIFAGITEVFGTMILPNVAESVQEKLLTFLTNFPFFLVTLFFLTLWFRHSVLYAPSDFRDDKNFLSLLRPDLKAPTVSSDVLDQQPAEASAKPVDQAEEQRTPETELAEPVVTPEADAENQPVQDASTEVNAKRYKRFIRSGQHINAVAKRLKEELSASYSLSQSPKNMPDLHFDIVLTGSDWNWVCNVAVVNDNNWEELLANAREWLNKVYTFQGSLSEKDGLKLQGLFCLIYSPDSLSEDNLMHLLIQLRGIELQYPFGSAIKTYDISELQA